MVRHTRIQSMNERIKREHHKTVRKLKNWAFDNELSVHDFSNASKDDVCVLSLNDYDISAQRSELSEDNESYFVDIESSRDAMKMLYNQDDYG